MTVGTAVANFLLANQLSPLGEDSATWYITLAVALVSQWCLLAVMCAFAGRNAIRGLVLGSALASIAVGAVLLGAWKTEVFVVEFWLPLATFPWLLPISAIGFSLIRRIAGWRLVANDSYSSDKVTLADCLVLMLWCSSGAIALRYIHLATEDQHLPILSKQLLATAGFAAFSFVLMTPMLWWFKTLRSQSRSVSLFLFALASSPTFIMLIALAYDRGEIESARSLVLLFLTIQVPFSYFFLGLWLLDRFGFRFVARGDWNSENKPSKQATPTPWYRLAMVWFICISMGFGYLTQVAEQHKLYETEFLQLLERTNRLRFIKDQRDRLSFPRGSQVTDSDLRALCAAESLRSLSLDRMPITDDGLRHLAAINHLESLSLANTKITDEGLVHLNRIESLKTLTLSDTSISGKGLHSLKSPERFTQLMLDGCRIATGHSPPVLQRFTSLQVLGLERTNISDKDLAGIDSLVNLRRVGLDGTGITDASLARFAPATRLVAISFANTSVTGRGFETWGRNNELKWVFANNSAFGDCGTTQLYKFPNLQFLYLSETQVVDIPQNIALENPQLQIIDLSDTNIDDQSGRRLFKLPAIVNLAIANTNITDSAFADCRSDKLARLNLNGTDITDEALQDIATLPALNDLRLARTAVTERGIAFLVGKRFKSLDLRGTSVTAKGLLAAQLVTLRSIVITEDQFSEDELALLEAHGTEAIYLAVDKQ